MTRPPSIAQVGCGKWGKNILRDLVAIGCEVTVVARSEESRSRAEDAGATAVVPRIEDLDSPDGVVVAVPTSIHVRVLDEVSALAVPIFVEKPLTDDVSAAARFAGRSDLFVMDKWRYHPGIEAMRRIKDEGKFGELKTLRTTRHSRYNPHTDVDAIWILAPHDLSIVLEVIGDIPEPTQAVGGRDGVESWLTGILGDNVVIDISSRAPTFTRAVVAIFDQAVVALSDGYANELEVWRGAPGVEPELSSIMIGDDMPLELELRAFVEHLGGGPPPRSSADDGILIVDRVQQLRDLAGI